MKFSDVKPTNQSILEIIRYDKKTEEYLTHNTNNTENNIHTDQTLHMIEDSCWMCLLENQLIARLKIIQLTVGKSC